MIFLQKKIICLHILFLQKSFIIKPNIMKSKTYALLLGVSALLAFNTANAFTSLVIISKPVETVKPSEPVISKKTDPLEAITAQQFLSLTPKTFQELTGKKMNLVQKVEFKMLQHKVKKMVKKGDVVTMADVRKKYDDLNSMNVLGFLLGLILGPIGVIIALILKETGDVGPETVKWSLYGLLIWLAIVLLIVIL